MQSSPNINSYDKARLIAGALLVLQCANVIYYAGQVASPLIRDDAWYYLESNVLAWSIRGIHLNDLITKRRLTDHVQPLYKLVTYLNYRYLKLDFCLDSVLGCAALVAVVFSIWCFFHRSDSSASLKQARACCGVMCCTGLMTSLNSTEIYTWPLVTFGFVSVALNMALAWVTWAIVYGVINRWLGLVIGGSLFFLLGDTASVITWASLTMVLFVSILKTHRTYQLKAIQWIAVAGAGVCGYFLICNAQFLFCEAASGVVGGHATGASPISARAMIYGLRVVMSTAVIHDVHLARFGAFGQILSYGLAGIMVLAYLRFIGLLFLARGPLSGAKFVAASILVNATVAVVMVAVSRVSVFGIDYFLQPRYVLTYQLIPAILILDYMGSLPNDTVVVRRIRFGAEALGVAALLGIYLFCSLQAYKMIPFSWMYINRQAKEIGRYAADRDLPADGCMIHNQTLCGLPLDRRNCVLDLLDREQLNLLNPNFQWRYRLFPLDLEAGNVPTKMAVSVWGPQTIQQTREAVGMWVTLERGLIDSRRQITIRLGDAELEPVVEGKVYTFAVPADIASSAGTYDLWLVEKSRDKQFHVGELVVEGIVGSDGGGNKPVNGGAFDSSTEKQKLPTPR